MDNEPADEASWLSDVDPALGVTDNAIDQLVPFEWVETRVNDATSTPRDRRARVGRRARTAVVVVATAVAVVAAFALWPHPAGLTVRSFTAIGVRDTHVGSSPANGLYAPLNGLPTYASVVVVAGQSRRWCQTAQLRGVLRGTISTNGEGWSGVVRLTNVGARCDIGITAATVMPFASDGLHLGPVPARTRGVARALVVLPHKSVAFTVAFLDDHLLVNGAGHASDCTPGTARTIRVLGVAPGWPFMSFTLPDSFGVCRDSSVNEATGDLTAVNS